MCTLNYPPLPSNPLALLPEHSACQQSSGQSWGLAGLRESLGECLCVHVLSLSVSWKPANLPVGFRGA